MDPAIEVEQVSKHYGDLRALDGVSLAIGAGEFFGLLGPNGAGKTTLINILAGLALATGGAARVMGHDVVREGPLARASLGVVPQEIALYEDLNAAQNLEYWGGAQGLRGAALKDRIVRALELTGLTDRAADPVKNFSGGMKRRLNFACGIVHEPKVLLLDEPTAGVDPQSRVRLLDLVREQAGAGTCVLYTTHYMEEAEALCDRLAIVDHGKIIAFGTLAELRAMMGERDLIRLTGVFEPEKVRQAVRSLEEVEVVQAEESIVIVSLRNASQRLPALFTAVGAAGSEIRDTTLTQPSLESLFIKLTGKELRE